MFMTTRSIVCSKTLILGFFGLSFAALLFWHGGGPIWSGCAGELDLAVSVLGPLSRMYAHIYIYIYKYIQVGTSCSSQTMDELGLAGG